MRSSEELLGILDLVCADVRDHAIGAVEVAERLVMVTDSAGEVKHAGGVSSYEDGGVIAFVNDSGQADELIDRAAKMNSVAVLLGGTAIT